MARRPNDKPLKWKDVDAPMQVQSAESLTNPNIRRAMPRIRLTTDGETLENYLISVILRRAPGGADFGALKEFEGERNLAGTLLNLLNGPINDGRDEPD